jgi:hypothetical protein
VDWQQQLGGPHAVGLKPAAASAAVPQLPYRCVRHVELARGTHDHTKPLWGRDDTPCTQAAHQAASDIECARARGLVVLM